jgi:hypothetical protein
MKNTGMPLVPPRNYHQCKTRQMYPCPYRRRSLRLTTDIQGALARTKPTSGTETRTIKGLKPAPKPRADNGGTIERSGSNVAIHYYFRSAIKAA